MWRRNIRIHPNEREVISVSCEFRGRGGQRGKCGPRPGGGGKQLISKAKESESESMLK